MAFLSDRKRKKERKLYSKFITFASIIELLISPFLGDLLNQSIIKLKTANFSADYNIDYLQALSNFFEYKDVRILTITINVIYIFFVLYISFSYKPKISKTDTMKITDSISIPYPSGNGQHGNERFMTKKEIKEDLYELLLPKNTKIFPTISEKIGLVVDVEENEKYEILRLVKGDKHSLTIGMNGSGKNRNVIFKSIFVQILKGNSLYINDVKGENYYYTEEFARKNNYSLYVIDLREPSKSAHYNYLQPIVDAYKKGDQTKAIDRTWDLVSALVGEPKGEPIWNNGECSSIAACILSIIWEAPEEFYKNMTNVYYFIAYMCKINDEGKMPLTMFLETLPILHPARTVFAMADMAHYRTRTSFFASALGTLKLFANPSIAKMTSFSDFSLDEISSKKSIVYMMLPDEKKTYYSLATLFITQLYTSQIDVSQKNGGRLPLDFHYFLDEAGNTPTIPILETGTTAGRSRGIIFDIFLQSSFQLKKLYKDSHETIKSNCPAKLLLKTDDESTLKEISGKLGNYTIEVPTANISVSEGKKTNANYSNSTALTKRALLEPSEVGKIQSPDALYMPTGKYAAITYLPDISSSIINDVLGLGDEKHNQELIMKKENERESIKENEEIKIWELWKEERFLSYEDFKELLKDEMLNNSEDENEEEKEKKRAAKVSFL